MDFPAFHLDFFGNRILFAVIGILHVLINHALAVGAVPFIALMEWRGHRQGFPAWDDLAYRILKVCFIITTSVGALTGVGIWFSASLVNPYAIASLLRVFFWFWLMEWLVFLAEVTLIMVYFLTWYGWGQRNKKAHIALGFGLSLFSWFTMAVIVAILGFMMHTGRWPQHPTLLSGILNPIYGPQLLFRTAAAMIAAGVWGLFLAYFFTKRGGDFRARVVRFACAWSLAWTPFCLAGAALYWKVIPQWMLSNLPVALATQAFEQWHRTLAYLVGAAVILVAVVALWGLIRPRWLPRWVLLAPFILSMAMLAYFERIREFIRKPYAIADYMYSSGLRPEEYPLLKEEGLLAHATYVSVRDVTGENRIEAGREVFTIACTRCHTVTGVNSVVSKLTGLYGPKPWEHAVVRGYLTNMHNTRPFMPPAPGSDEELDALTDYLLSLQQNPQRLEGAQTVGVQSAALPAARGPDAAAALQP
jgi:mono/diheme cytochrome c family protein